MLLSQMIIGVGNRIRLSGNVTNAVDLQKAITAAEQFSAAPVINATVPWLGQVSDRPLSHSAVLRFSTLTQRVAGEVRPFDCGDEAHPDT